MGQLTEEKQEISIIKRALLVEDNKLCYKFMTSYLNQLGYHVDLSDDSATAIQAMQNKTYDLMIVDVNLHGARLGEKIIRMARESELNVGSPIIAWSAYINKNDEEWYLSWGADTALIKNCGFEGLKEAIQKCLLTTRYERQFHRRIKLIERKWREDGGRISLLEELSNLHNRQLLILVDALESIMEYNQWADLPCSAPGKLNISHIITESPNP